MSEFATRAQELDGVRQLHVDGGLRWQLEGRLIARELDETHVVIRCAFDARDVLLHQDPETFSLPDRFAQHMMIVADLAEGYDDAIDDALLAAWRLQREDH